MKASFIGSGNMGGAIARGLVNSGFFAAEDVICCDRNASNLKKMSAACSLINTTSDARLAAGCADLVVLSVKPWSVEALD